MTFHRMILVVLFILVSACSPLKEIKHPDRPLELESAFLLPPKGNGWRYVKQDHDEVFDLHFSRQGISPSHKTSARYLEFEANTNFATPEHFLNYIRHVKEGDLDDFEYKVVKRQWALDTKFGEYSLRYYLVLKHIDPAAMNPRDYSLIKRYGYVILHPYINNKVIDIFYDEEGKPIEINPNFEQNAIQFIDGLQLKKGKD